MRSYYPTVGLQRLCGLFGKSRQAFYEQSWYIADQQLEEGFLIEQIKALRQTLPGMGGVKLHKVLKQQLQDHHVIIGRDRFFTLLRNNDLLVRRRRKYVRTTDSYHHYRKWPDLTADLVINGASQLWVSDITYLSTENGFTYLSLVTDAYSRKIVGYHLSQQLKAQGPVIALK